MHNHFNKYFTYKYSSKVIPIELITHEDCNAWLKKQPALVKSWLTANNFTAKPNSFCLLPNNQGGIARVFLGVENADDVSAIGVLPDKLSKGVYKIVNKIASASLAQMVFSWAMANYKFTKYKKLHFSAAQLLLSKNGAILEALKIAESYALIMDLANTPAEDMYPEILAKEAASLAKQYHANFKQIVGNDLLHKNFPAIHAVGRSSVRAPRLIEITWGKKTHPEVVLIGKGVCFDSGGFDLKPAFGMVDMKSDMAGAAHVLGLAKLIMEFKLPINLRVLIPAVENLIDSKSYKPGDVIKTRKGLTIEIDNTDAEGRVILADALALACEKKPDVIFDFATLTGAAKVALGLEIPALFTDDEKLAQELSYLSKKLQEPLWRLPIYTPYRSYLDSKIADIRNGSGGQRFGGAIFGALFLKEFVKSKVSWVHLDINALSQRPQPGKPLGAWVDGVRTVFAYLRSKYGNNN